MKYQHIKEANLSHSKIAKAFGFKTVKSFRCSSAHKRYMHGIESILEFIKTNKSNQHVFNVIKSKWQDIKTLPANDDDFCTFARFDNKGNIITSFTGTLSLTRAFRKYEMANQYTHWIKLPAPPITDKTKP